MDLRQLAVLTAIADHGSFSAAARALFTVQSNVSAHVARLERELGATLVDRATGRLTPEGEVVVARARRVQAELDALHADLASRGQLVAGDARLGVIGTTGRWLVPQLLAALQARHPAVRLVVVDASTTSLVPQLVSGRLDLALVNLPVTDPDVEIQGLFTEDLIVLCGPSSPLYGREEVTLAELAEQRLLLPPPGTAMRDEIDLEARRRGVVLEPVAEIDGMRLLASLGFEDFAAAIVPATAVPGWLKGPFQRVAVPELPRRQVGLARRRRTVLSAPARAVADTLLTVVQERGPRQPGVHLVEPAGTGAPHPASERRA